MKVKFANGSLLVDNVYYVYRSKEFIINLYKAYLKPVKTLINILVDRPNDLDANIALRLKNGEKLEICYYNEIDKLVIYDIHQYFFMKSKYSKYLYLYNSKYKKYSYLDVSFANSAVMFKPNIEVWDRENKPLNDTTLKSMIDDYKKELNEELSKFESMIVYTDLSIK